MGPSAAANIYGVNFPVKVTPTYITYTVSIRASLVDWTLSFTFDGTYWLFTRSHPVPGSLAVITVSSTPYTVEPWDDLLIVDTDPAAVNLSRPPFLGEVHKFYLTEAHAYTTTLNSTEGLKIAGFDNIVTTYDIFGMTDMCTITFTGSHWLTEVSPKFSAP
jgi:hypothetical protein